MRENFNQNVTDELDADDGVEDNVETKAPIVLSMILRLRQLADHPFLVEPAIKEYLTNDDIEVLLSTSHDLEGLNHRSGRTERFLRLREVLAENAGSHKDTSRTDENSTKSSSNSLSLAEKFTLTNKDFGGRHGTFNVRATVFKPIG
jgi:SNF2 family DNA or RNA helicase